MDLSTFENPPNTYRVIGDDDLVHLVGAMFGDFWCYADDDGVETVEQTKATEPITCEGCQASIVEMLAGEDS